MKKIFSLMILTILCLNLVVADNGNNNSNNGNSGSIWTTRNGCDTPQNENEYNIGDEIWIKGEGFVAGNYDWKIMEVPEGDSVPIISGSYTVDGSGSFCLDTTYLVQEDDSGVYKAYFDGKHDNYHVIPEFGAVVGVLTILSALGIFFFVRR